MRCRFKKPMGGLALSLAVLLTLQLSAPARAQEIESAEPADSVPAVYDETSFDTQFDSELGYGSIVTGFSAAGKALFDAHSQQTVNIPERIAGTAVTGIGAEAFRNLPVETVGFPPSLKHIDDAAFAGTALAELSLPDALQDIHQNAFAGSRLTAVRIPESVRTIGLTAFAWNQIESGRFEIDNVPGAVDVHFTALQNNGPDNDQDIQPVYLKTPPPSPEPEPEAPGSDSDAYGPEDFTYSDAGNMVAGLSSAGSKKHDRLGSKVRMVLPTASPAGVSIVGVTDYAFQDDVLEVETVELPKGYTVIEPCAFWEATIQSVEASDDLSEIGSMAFYNTDGRRVQIRVSSAEVAGKIDNQSRDYCEVVAHAAPEPDPEPEPEPQDGWQASDYIYEDIEVAATEDDGSEQTVRLHAVSGFSEAGLEKLKSNLKVELPAADAGQQPVEAVAPRAFASTYGKKTMTSVRIPEGYRYIGSMAFAFVGLDGELELPDTLEFIDSAAFFQNNLAKVVFPEHITVISNAAFRANRLTEIQFKGELTEIGRLAFAVNRLSTVHVPDSLASIGEQAFVSNNGEIRYGDKVVIRTASGKNPKQLPDSEDYLIDPAPGGDIPEPDYTKWETADFTYKGQTVTGFSAQGGRKIKKNKKLAIPDLTPDGKPVLVIGTDAFRNLNLGYDIETLTLPETVREIRDYAFQFNDITEFKMPRDLERMGYGVLMLSNTERLILNDRIRYIDQACFFGCSIGEIEFPASVEHIMNAAFRRCSLTSVRFKPGSRLKTIAALAFADNRLSDVEIPEGVTQIGDQAFADNRFTELTVPDSVEQMGYQTFLHNPGTEQHHAVVVHTKEMKNIHGLGDDLGGTYVVDPGKAAAPADRARLQELLAEVNKVDESALSDPFATFFKSEAERAQQVYDNAQSSAANVLSAVRSLEFALRRSAISIQMARKEKLEPEADTFDPAAWQDVLNAYQTAKTYIMILNVRAAKIDQIVDDLANALDYLKNSGPLAGATAYTGETEMPKTHYIEPYALKVKVWVRDGVIVHVHDNGTVTDDPEEDEEHNRSYFEDARTVLRDYAGKKVSDVLKQSQQQMGIDAVSGATVTARRFHQAVVAALKKVPAQPNPTQPKPTQPKPTQPKPTQPKPTQPKPTQPKPTQPKPTQPKPTQPKPTQPKPTQPKPTQSKPTQPKPNQYRIEVFRTGARSSYKVGETIALAARAEGGRAPYRYQFFVIRSSGARVNLTSLRAVNTFSWKPETPDSGYKVGVDVVDAAGRKLTKTAPVKVLKNPSAPSGTVKIPVFRTGARSSYKVGETIALAARAEGGRAPYRYQFFVIRSSGARVNLTSLRAVNTFSWKPETPDSNYKVGVDVVDAAGHKATRMLPVKVIRK